MNASPRPKRHLRSGLVALLVVAAFFVALPWLGCVWHRVPSVIIDPRFLGFCTFGFPGPLPVSAFPGFTGPYWGNLIGGVAYLIAASYVAFTKSSL